MQTDPRAEIGTHRSWLLHYARQRLGNPAHAEDAVQDAMVAALEGFQRYAGHAALGTWLTGILKHKIVDCVRRTARDSSEPLDADVLPADGRDPEAEAHGSGVLRRLDRYLAELPSKAAQVFMLRDVLGMSAAETGAQLAISENHCGVLLHRARRRLRDQLSDERAGIGA
jgi:RNA polymerase sigma-70 factor (ECF subfamily)